MLTKYAQMSATVTGLMFSTCVHQWVIVMDAKCWSNSQKSRTACSCRSRQQQARPTYSAGIRKQVYAAIVGRNADLAMQLVEQHFPDILNPGGESSAALYLCCQSFIDKVCSCAPLLHATKRLQSNISL